MNMHMEIPMQTAITGRVREPVEGGPFWFAYVAMAGQNELADQRLRQAGYMTFYPFERVRVRTRIPGTQRFRVHWKEVPYFGRYGFVAIRYHGESLYEIDEIDGVATVWRPGKRPMWLEPKVMNAIMELGEKGGEVKASTPSLFKIGQKFQIAAGHVFAGFVAEMSNLAKLDNQGIIKAWVDVFGSRHEAEMPAWAVGESA